jgi:hypothetical protein
LIFDRTVKNMPRAGFDNLGILYLNVPFTITRGFQL